MVMGFLGGVGCVGAVLMELLMLSRPRKVSHTFCVIPGKPLYAPASSFPVSRKFGGQTPHAPLIAQTLKPKTQHHENIPPDPN